MHGSMNVKLHYKIANVSAKQSKLHHNSVGKP